jgi:mRNA interferase MazF
MLRGELHLLSKPGPRDPKKQRVFAIVSRRVLIDSKFSTVIRAPVYSGHDGLETQVRVGVEEGLKLKSSLHCGELVSLPRAALTRFVERLSPAKLRLVERALRTALALA